MALSPTDLEQIRALIREELIRAGLVTTPPAPQASTTADEDPRHADASRLAKIGIDLRDAARSSPQGFKELVAIMMHGADREQRLLACEYAGELGDEALLPFFEQLTADRRDPELYEASLRGLLAMWLSPPFFETTSKAAYKLTCKRLEGTPRVVPVGVIADLHMATYERGDLERVASWFKPAAFRDVLGPLVIDPAVDYVGRGILVEVLVNLGASRKDLERLRKQVPAVTDEDRHVADALDTAIRRAS